MIFHVSARSYFLIEMMVKLSIHSKMYRSNSCITLNNDTYGNANGNTQRIRNILEKERERLARSFGTEIR